jgi:hypothetical protein
MAEFGELFDLFEDEINDFSFVVISIDRLGENL